MRSFPATSVPGSIGGNPESIPSRVIPAGPDDVESALRRAPPNVWRRQQTENLTEHVKMGRSLKRRIRYTYSGWVPGRRVPHSRYMPSGEGARAARGSADMGTTDTRVDTAADRSMDISTNPDSIAPDAGCGHVGEACCASGSP